MLTVYHVAASTSWNMELVASGESGRSRKGCVLKCELKDASGGMDFWCGGEVGLDSKCSDTCTSKHKDIAQ